MPDRRPPQAARDAGAGAVDAAYRGRYAPSPTGELHLGSAAAAVICAAAARAAGGALILRMEDIDTPRLVAGAARAILDDLRWLGIDWQEGPDVGGPTAPYVQSERTALYQAAVDDLARCGLTYLCDCSRAEIARIASAPHAGEDGPRYPGTCRSQGMRARDFRRPPAVRLAVPEGDASRVEVVDGACGTFEEDVARTSGDFVLRRGDGVFAYQLAVVVDDIAMGISDVVRGADLLGSAARQILLARLLGARLFRFLHLPLVVAADGGRLAKRAPRMTLREQRATGRDPRELIRSIAAAYGHPLGGGQDPIGELAARFDPALLPRAPIDVSRIAG